MRLTVQDWTSALLHGDKAKIADIEQNASTKVSGELLENIVADAVAKNLKGIPALTYILDRTGGWGKYGVEAIGILASPEFVNVLFTLLERVGFNRTALNAARPFVTNVAEGYVRGQIKASEPDHVRKDKIKAIEQRVSAQTSRAFRDAYGYVHLTQLDAAGNPLPFDANGYPQACVGWQTAVGGWIAHHPSTTRQQGGGRNQQGQQNGQQVTVPGTRMPIAEGELESLLSSGGLPCPHCLKIHASGATPAPKAETFWQKVEKSPACKDVLAAARWFAAHNPRSKIAVDFFEDIAGIDFDAFRMLCEDLYPRVTIVAPGGTRHHAEMDEATIREFLLGLDAIGCELKGLNKADEAAHGAWEEIKHAWEHHRSAAFLTIAGLAAIPVGYILSGVAIICLFVAGVFGNFEDQGVNIKLTTLSTILGLVWLMLWYSATGIRAAFGGIVHSHADAHGVPSLANTARAITALMCGIGVTAILICGVGKVWEFPTFEIRLVVASVALIAIIGYDRIGARWHESEVVHHLLEALSVNNIKTLAALASVMAVIGIGPFAYMEYAKVNSKFPLAVERQDVGGVGVYYIPTPDGKVFRPEDVVGRIVAEQIESGMEGDPSVAGDENSRVVLCLTEGTVVDLPKYAEKAGKRCADADGNAGTPYTIRPNLFGIGWGDAKAYDSLGELAADQRQEADEAKRTVQAATQPKPAATPTPAPQPSAPAASETYTNVVKPVPTHRGVDCSGLSFRERQKRGC